MNWPIKGWHIHTGLPANLANSLAVILMFAITAGCDGALPNQLTLPDNSNTLPTLLSSPSPILATENVALTVESVVTPNLDACQIAVAGIPLDVSIPDGTILDPGEAFIKIWRIRNAGTCEWTNEYTIEWFSGDPLGVSKHVEIIHPVLPGETVEIAVDMIAPFQMGVYQSNWKICDSVKNCFGLGPNGAYPFWARIQVRQVTTVTPSTMATLTPPAVVFLSGQTELSPGENFDLDRGMTDQSEEGDIQFMITDAGLVLNSLNQTKLIMLGVGNPEEMECLNLLKDTATETIETFEPLSVICFQSTQGLPGVIKVNRIDLESQKISIEYLTWYAP